MIYAFVLQVFLVMLFTGFTWYGLIKLHTQGRIDILSRAVVLLTGFVPIITIVTLCTVYQSFWTLYAIPLLVYSLLHVGLLLKGSAPAVSKLVLNKTAVHAKHVGTELHIKNGYHLWNVLHAMEGFICIQFLFSVVFATLTQNVITSGVVLASMNLLVLMCVLGYLRHLRRDIPLEESPPV